MNGRIIREWGTLLRNTIMTSSHGTEVQSIPLTYTAALVESISWKRECRRIGEFDCHIAKISQLVFYFQTTLFLTMLLMEHAKRSFCCSYHLSSAKSNPMLVSKACFCQYASQRFRSTVASISLW